MSRADSIQRHKNIISRHKEMFIRKREQLFLDSCIDSYEKEHAKLFRDCSSGKITLDEFNEKSASLEMKKKKRLIELGESEDVMTYRPLCEKCDDTGNMNGKVCSCLTKIIVEDNYRESGIYEVLQRENFDNFNFDLFGDEVNERYGRSTKNHMKLIYKRAVNYVRNFDKETSSLLFSGSVGVGKTYLAHCITKALIDEGYYVVFTTAGALLKELVDYNFGKRSYNEVERYYTCDLLVIDEVGSEASNEYNRSMLYDIVNERMIRGRKILMTSNFTMESLKNIYEERLVSRISTYELIPFIPGDLRLKSRMRQGNK